MMSLIPVYLIIIPLFEYPYLLLLWKIHQITAFIWYFLPALGAMLFLSIKSTQRWVIYNSLLVCSVFVIAPFVPDKYAVQPTDMQMDILNIMTIIISLLFIYFFLYYLNEIYKARNIIWNGKQQQSVYSLQHTVLATTLALSQKQMIINNLTQQSEHLDSNIKTMLREEKNLDKNIEDFKETVAAVHPKFFRNLEQQAKPNNLTVLDIKYCVYIYMGFTNRDIANAFHVEIDSVKGKKKLLKRKLHLTASENLGEFIRMVETIDN
jgi:hypothetical protein